MNASRGFAGFIADARRRSELVVQPRMGFSCPRHMRRGLQAVRAADAVTAGTITVDSYTRVGDELQARRAVDEGVPLNGYPIVTHGGQVTREMIAGIAGEGFPVQVRHGSAMPERIIAASLAAGIAATEGGPVSYCLPYTRTPLRRAVRDWARAAERLAGYPDAHLESFGGCMLGQLCPPSLLVALSVLEGMFFARHGVPSVSLSYAQQTHADQDAEALTALNRLATERLDALDWHVVLYTYMGVYPSSRRGAFDLLADAAMLARRGGASRLIVKTPAEARRIPTIEENVESLEFAAAAGRYATGASDPADDTGLYEEAAALVDSVCELADDLDEALVRAFERGYLDVPFCLHPDNRGAAASYLGSDGRLRWARIGSMPLSVPSRLSAQRDLTSSDLLSALSFVARSYDG